MPHGQGWDPESKSICLLPFQCKSHVVSTPFKEHFHHWRSWYIFTSLSSTTKPGEILKPSRSNPHQVTELETKGQRSHVTDGTQTSRPTFPVCHVLSWVGDSGLLSHRMESTESTMQEIMDPTCQQPPRSCHPQAVWHSEGDPGPLTLPLWGHLPKC